MTKLKCPHCNIELEIDDTYDMDYDYEGITLRQIGHCPECKRDYQWEHTAECSNWEITNLHGV